MKFSLAAAALLSLLQVTSAIPSESQTDAAAPVEVLDEAIPSTNVHPGSVEEIESQEGHAIYENEDGDDAGNSTSIAARTPGLFTKYPCTQSLRLHFWKSGYCRGHSTRTDIYNFPLPELYNKRCQDLTSKSPMLGMKGRSDLIGMRVVYYEESGCKGRSKVLVPSYMCETHKYKGKDGFPPIKSFKIVPNTSEKKCRSNSKNGVPGDSDH